MKSPLRLFYCTCWPPSVLTVNINHSARDITRPNTELLQTPGCMEVDTGVKTVLLGAHGQDESPSRPASCSWILSISMGVVMTTWHMPAPQPASISLNTVSPFLPRRKHNMVPVSGQSRATEREKKWREKGFKVSYPFLLRCWRKKSLAASLMAFSGVTRVRLTAAPEGEKQVGMSTTVPPSCAPQGMSNHDNDSKFKTSSTTVD